MDKRDSNTQELWIQSIGFESRAAFESGKFGAVLSLEVIEHIYNPQFHGSEIMPHS